MNKLFSKKNKKGQGLVEYSIILALVAIVVIGVTTTLGKKTCNAFSSIGNSLDGGSSSGCTAAAPANGKAYDHWPNSAYEYCASASSSTTLQLYNRASPNSWVAGAPGQTMSGYSAAGAGYPTTCGQFIAQGHADLRSDPAHQPIP